MSAVVKVAKIGESATSTDPNDFVFHSDYNTFKIISEGTKSVTLAASTNNQTFNQAHSLDFIPLVSGFAKESGIAQVFLPNSENVNTWSSSTGWIGTGVKFNYIASDITNVIFNFDNTNGSTKDVSIRYFVLEKVN